MTSIKIYRNGVFFAEILPSSNSVQEKKIMGDNQIKIDFETSYNLQFNVGDYATVFGEVYKINKLPVVNKISAKRYKYTLTMNAEYYDLNNVQYLFYDAENRLKEGDFSLMGNLDQFMDLMGKNILRVYTGWSFGEVPNSAYKSITFSNDSCLSALTKIVEAFDTEYWIEGKKISIIKRKNQKSDTYRHGKNLGLYEINRQINDQVGLVTRIYPFGSDKNIPTDYRDYSKRLRLPEKDEKLISNLICSDIRLNLDGSQRYVFNWDTPINPDVEDITILYRNVGSSAAYSGITVPKASPAQITLLPGLYEFSFRSNAITGSLWTNKATTAIPITAPFTTPFFQGNSLPYVESNVAKYGVIERTIVFDDIYPSRTGKVTSVSVGDPYELTDADIDFDVNGYLLPGIVAKITFNTGQLAGYTFDISSFNNSTKKFRILKNKNENQIDIPSSLLRPAIGDLYVLTDIKMPQQYIELAEQKLLQKANDYMSVFSLPSYLYTIVFDPIYLKEKQQLPVIGDVVWIEDNDLELNKPIRIISTARNIVNEYDISIEMADILSNNTIQRLASSISNLGNGFNSISSDVKNNNLLQNNKTTGDFKIEMGTIVAKDIMEKPVGATLKTVYVDEATGIFYKG